MLKVFVSHEEIEWCGRLLRVLRSDQGEDPGRKRRFNLRIVNLFFFLFLGLKTVLTIHPPCKFAEVGHSWAVFWREARDKLGVGACGIRKVLR